MKKLIGLMAGLLLLGLSSVFAQSKQMTGTDLHFYNILFSPLKY